MLAQLILTLSIACALILAGVLIERRISDTETGSAAISLNLMLLTLAASVQALFAPMLAGLTTWGVGALSGGLVRLSADGWRLGPSLIAYTLAMDLAEYGFHRAQHRVPALWAMHSLHHSDPDVNVSTTVRHYWAERLIKSVTIYAAVGLVFKVDLTVVNLYALISFYNYFSHMHVKVGYGRWAVLLNSPQYHRIHHSVLAEHYDCNFAALFPIFDRLFGTYRQPLPGQFPPTGLDGAEAPADLWQSLAWPARGLVRSRLARALREPRP